MLLFAGDSVYYDAIVYVPKYTFYIDLLPPEGIIILFS